MEQTVSEVDVLRYFETEAIEKAMLLFNIVSHKMKGRLQTQDDQGSPIGRRTRRSKRGETPGVQQESHSDGEGQTPLAPG